MKSGEDKDEPGIVAGIQNVYEKVCDLGTFDLIIVDEAHLIAPDGDGMYRSFLKDMKVMVINPKVRVIVLTATPFRLKGGLICQPENILDEVSSFPFRAFALFVFTAPARYPICHGSCK